MPSSVVLGQQADELAGQVLEELAVGDRPRAVGLALAVVEEDQVDVAGVVQFAAAELAHAQDDEPGRPAVGRRGRRPAAARSFRHAARKAPSRIASAR